MGVTGGQGESKGESLCPWATPAVSAQPLRRGLGIANTRLPANGGPRALERFTTFDLARFFTTTPPSSPLSASLSCADSVSSIALRTCIFKHLRFSQLFLLHSPPSI